jgi:selenocysteine lyase/cysteine desulfurase
LLPPVTEPEVSPLRLCAKVLGVTDTTRPEARTSTFAVAKSGFTSWELAEALCKRGIWCTAGNHYAGFWHKQTAGVADNDNGMARIGFLHYNTLDEVDRALRALDAV